MKSGIQTWSAIVITVDTGKEAAKLYSKELRLREALKIVEKYWEVEPGLVCLSYISIGHNCWGKCKNQIVWCVIYIGAYKVEDHRYKVTSYTMKMSKICTHVTSNCANYEVKHQATIFKYSARLKAQAEIWKKKSRKLLAKNKKITPFAIPEEEIEAGSNNIEVDTWYTIWAQSLEQEALNLSSFKDNRFENPELEIIGDLY